MAQSLFRRLALILLAAFLALGVGVPAQAQEFPPVPQGPVYDGANILSQETEAQLDTRLRAYNRDTGRAIIVATVPQLPAGQTVESYATGLYADWGIGGAERDMGLLLLVARDDRKMRIEVGYGLHPYFGGIMAGRVIRDVITPRFKAGDYDGGVTEGVNAIVSHLANSPEDAIAIEEAAKQAEQQRQSEGGFPVGALIWLGFVFFFFILPLMRRTGRRGYRRMGTGSAIGNIILWEAANAAMRGSHHRGGGWGGGGFGGGGGGGGFGGFGGGLSGGGGASGSW